LDTNQQRRNAVRLRALRFFLGAAALGDIGRHFPDTDSAFKGADSIDREYIERLGLQADLDQWRTYVTDLPEEI